MLIIKKVMKIKKEYLRETTSLKTNFIFFIGHFCMKYQLKKKKVQQEKKWSSPGNRKVSHITMYEVRNVGDNVLSECVRVLFDKYFGKQDWNLISIEEPVTSELIEKLNNSKYIIVGGHGAFIPMNVDKSVSGWKWNCRCEQYSLIKSSLIVFGIGYNYFKGIQRGNLFENNIRELVYRADFIGLRNRGSIKEVQTFLDNELSDKIKLQPCPTMFTRYLFDNIPEKRETRKIAFNVALDRIDNRLGKNADYILCEIAKAMHLIQERGYEIHFIAHCEWEVRFLEYIKNEHIKCIYHHITAKDTLYVLKLYNEMDMVIGMRGHGIWIPFGVDCHILALGNQDKTKWFLEDINALDWMIDLSSNLKDLAELIVEKFVEIHEKRNRETTERIKAAQKRLYEITMDNMKNIANIIVEE